MRRNIVRMAIILSVAALITVGLLVNEAQIVLTKATALCYACIGIG